MTFEERLAQIPKDTPRPKLVGILDPFLDEIAAVNRPMGEAHLRTVKEHFSLTPQEVSGYRQEIKDRRKTFGDAAKDLAQAITWTLSIHGLVDVVEHDGKSAFLIKDGDKLEIKSEIENDAGLFQPPPKSRLPWLLPRGAEVIRHYKTDRDHELYDDLVVYHKRVSELPSEAHYHLLAAWDYHTHLMEPAKYSPYIWLYGVPERGKTRTGQGM